jgi:hypothetical protein
MVVARVLSTSLAFRFSRYAALQSPPPPLPIASAGLNADNLAERQIRRELLRARMERLFPFGTVEAKEAHADGRVVAQNGDDIASGWMPPLRSVSRKDAQNFASRSCSTYLRFSR